MAFALVESVSRGYPIGTDNVYGNNDDFMRNRASFGSLCLYAAQNYSYFILEKWPHCVEVPFFTTPRWDASPVRIECDVRMVAASLLDLADVQAEIFCEEENYKKRGAFLPGDDERAMRMRQAAAEIALPIAYPIPVCVEREQGTVRGVLWLVSRTGDSGNALLYLADDVGKVESHTPLVRNVRVATPIAHAEFSSIVAEIVAVHDVVAMRSGQKIAKEN